MTIKISQPGNHQPSQSSAMCSAIYTVQLCGGTECSEHQQFKSCREGGILVVIPGSSQLFYFPPFLSATNQTCIHCLQQKSLCVILEVMHVLDERSENKTGCKDHCPLSPPTAMGLCVVP